MEVSIAERFAKASESAESSATTLFLFRGIIDPRMEPFLPGDAKSSCIARFVREFCEDPIRNSREEILSKLRDLITVAAVAPIQMAGNSYANSHEAAVDIESRIVAAIRRAAGDEVGLVASTLGLTVPFQTEKITENWTSVREAILKFPGYDTSALAAAICKERVEVMKSLREAVPNASVDPPRVVKATINSRMLDTIQKVPEATGWTVTQWETHLGCSRGAIAKAPAWQSLKVVKAEQQLSKAEPKDRRRKK